MSYVKQFTVGGRSYNAVMASAADQDKLMSLLSAALIERAVAMARQGQTIGQDVVVPMFMAMPHDRKSQVATILMCNVKVNGSDIKVDIEHFRNKLVQYNQLLGELLVWNLGDFFDYLLTVVSAEVQQAQQAPVL
ncbi:MAG: hypothetical protein ACRDCI_18650 [Plesiomonas shigelloides]